MPASVDLEIHQSQQINLLNLLTAAKTDLLCFTILAGMPSQPVAFLIFILFIIFSTFSVVVFWNSKLITGLLCFWISKMLRWVDWSYVTPFPIFSATVEKKSIEMFCNLFGIVYNFVVFHLELFFVHLNYSF